MISYKTTFKISGSYCPFGLSFYIETTSPIIGTDLEDKVNEIAEKLEDKYGVMDAYHSGDPTDHYFEWDRTDYDPKQDGLIHLPEVLSDLFLEVYLMCNDAGILSDNQI